MVHSGCYSSIGPIKRLHDLEILFLLLFAYQYVRTFCLIPWYVQYVGKMQFPTPCWTAFFFCVSFFLAQPGLFLAFLCVLISLVSVPSLLTFIICYFSQNRTSLVPFLLHISLIYLPKYDIPSSFLWKLPYVQSVAGWPTA